VNLWAVAGWVPGIKGLRRRMSIVRRADGGLLFFNAVPVDDATLARIRSLGRPSMLVADVVLNVPNGQGITGLVFRLLGMTGDAPRLPLPVRLRVVADGKALQAHLEDLSRTPGLARIVTSHGAIISREPGDVLREIAAGL
jgi:hypothetical protein